MTIDVGFRSLSPIAGVTFQKSATIDEARDEDIFYQYHYLSIYIVPVC
jgi:hypothetical protein